MNVDELLRTENLERSVLIGYYGGGNYGDELLLEVLANLLKEQGVQEVTVTYQTPETYATLHHDFGYPLVQMGDKKALLRTIFKNKNVIIGGGGLWGLDMNANIFLLSCLLFLSRLSGKRVFLLGVGYYNSTSRLGHIAAWLAGKAARYIIARDQETFENFRRVTRRVSLDKDIAWHIPSLDLSAYRGDLARLEAQVSITQKTLFITLRRFRSNQPNEYTQLVEQCLSDNPDTPIVVALMEPRSVDPEGYRRLQAWQKKHPALQILDFSYNPLALFLFFKKHCRQLVFVGPQFHAIITAQLAGVPFLPVAYDNKVSRLLEYLDVQPIPITELSQPTLQSFITAQVAQA